MEELYIMTTWNIHTEDGTYIGQCESRDPTTAFCRCMEAFGKVVEPSEVGSTALEKGAFRKVYRETTFMLYIRVSDPAPWRDKALMHTILVPKGPISTES